MKALSTLARWNGVKLERMYAGCYRYQVDSSDPVFAQIKRNGTYWVIELRKTESGDLIRYAGSFNTLRDAANDAFGEIKRQVRGEISLP